jgi:hypothetical protein
VWVSLRLGRALVSDELLQNTFIVTLANLLTTEILESRAEWAVDVVVLAYEAVLSCITQWVKLVAPVASKVEPTDGGGRSQIRG